MAKNIRCECGHVNPKGTELCEACGKPFEYNKDGSLNMRYEGAARRSQTYQKTFIDHIWNFFSSVKVGIWLMTITLLVSMLGTLFPQQMYIPQTADPYEYYPDRYGFFGYMYVIFGLHNMYSSWWYVTLLILIGLSLFISSVDRIVPLYRSLKKQRVTRNPLFLSGQRIHGRAPLNNAHTHSILDRAKEALQKKRYRVRVDERALLAEKGRFTRWGPYVIHFGLIIFLIGALMRVLPGFMLDDEVYVRDGETVPVPGTEYYLHSEGFDLTTYTAEDFPMLVDQVQEGETLIPQEFRTDAILYEQAQDPQTGENELVEVARHEIRVNDPLIHEGLQLFQANYILNEFKTFSFQLYEKESEQAFGEITVDLSDPELAYELENGYVVEVERYFPDFYMQEGEPSTASSIPNNPAFVFRVIPPDQDNGEISWVFFGQTIEPPGEANTYELRISDIEFNHVSGLMVRKERTMPVMYSGWAIVLIGLVMCFYWQHRRIWVQREGNEVWISAHTNKNWYGLTQEVHTVIDAADLKMDKERLDKESNA